MIKGKQKGGQGIGTKIPDPYLGPDFDPKVSMHRDILFLRDYHGRVHRLAIMADVYTSLQLSPRKKRYPSQEDDRILTPKKLRTAYVFFEFFLFDTY